KRMNTQNGETMRFDYDFTGTRIRKTRSSDQTKTISLGGLYEIVMTPGQSPQHTLYFRGLSGDLVSRSGHGRMPFFKLRFKNLRMRRIFFLGSIGGPAVRKEILTGKRSPKENKIRKRLRFTKRVSFLP
ncbi:hypothetical protein, partial [Leptospira stimsonii]